MFVLVPAGIVSGTTKFTVTRLSDNSVITDSIEIGETEAELQVNEFILSLIFYFK